MTGEIARINWGKRIILVRMDDGSFCLLTVAWRNAFQEGDRIRCDCSSSVFSEITNFHNNETMQVFLKTRTFDRNLSETLFYNQAGTSLLAS